jgi:hypothetical protein
MDDNYDEFGNYIGPELVDEDEQQQVWAWGCGCPTKPRCLGANGNNESEPLTSVMSHVNFFCIAAAR